MTTDVWRDREISRHDHQNEQAKRNGYRPISAQSPSFEGYLPLVVPVSGETDKVGPRHRLDVDPLQMARDTIGRRQKQL